MIRYVLQSDSRFDVITDIAIIGAGPGGCATSIFLSEVGISHTIFDKSIFPRDKICGDAISGKAVAIFNRMNKSPILAGIRSNDSTFLGSWGVTFVAPNGKPLDVPFKMDLGDQKDAPGFIAKRYDFDQYMIEQLDHSTADTHFGANVKNVQILENCVKIEYQQGGEERTCSTQLVIGAEGDRSIVAKKLANHKLEPGHYCAGIRAYYENVRGLHKDNFIELHFLPEVLPGYFWIFPLPDNMANVGVGMLSKAARKKNVNIKKAMLQAIQENPTIKDRFRDSVLRSEITGWGLPLGSKKRNLSGERFMLVGDAASLIDPFTGEGIGNAMVSGMIAAHTAQQAKQENDFSQHFLERYDDEVYKEVWSELKLSHTLQKLVNFPWLFNFLVNKARKNKTIQETITCMFEDLDMRAKLRSPSFYLKLLVN